MPDHLIVEYHYGMNEVTMRDELRRRSITPRESLTDLEQQFLQETAPRLADHLEVSFGGARLEPASVESELIYQHHFQFGCRLTYEADFRRSPSPLVIEDANFTDRAGFVRAAIKGRGGIEIKSANVPPLVVRAERRAVTQLEPGAAGIVRIEALAGALEPNPEPPSEAEVAADNSANDSNIGHDTSSESTVERRASSRSSKERRETVTEPQALPWTWIAAGGLVLVLLSLPWLLLPGQKRRERTARESDRVDA